MKKITKNTLAGLLAGAMTLLPGMYNGSNNAEGENLMWNKNHINKEIIDNYAREYNYRKINKSKIPENAKKLHKEIVSYAGDTATLYIPEYILSKKDLPTCVGPTKCSRYSRFAAKELFDLNYVKEAGAWDMRYSNKIVQTNIPGFEKDNLEDLVEERILQPGMLIGFYNPKSNYKNGIDKTGKKRMYTHIGVYIGDDKVAHQWGKETRIDNLDWFYNKKLTPKEILDANESY